MNGTNRFSIFDLSTNLRPRQARPAECLLIVRTNFSRTSRVVSPAGGERSEGNGRLAYRAVGQQLLARGCLDFLARVYHVRLPAFIFRHPRKLRVRHHAVSSLFWTKAVPWAVLKDVKARIPAGLIRRQQVQRLLPSIVGAVYDRAVLLESTEYARS